VSQNKYFLITFFILLLTAAMVLNVARRGVPQVVATNLENLPMEIAGYRGKEDRFPQEVYDTLDADLHLYRHYNPADGSGVSLYLGYYGTAKGGRTGHNPFACLPGAGWGIVQSDTVRVYPDSYPNGVDINFVVAGKDGVNNVMLHWYQSAGSTVLSSGLQQNLDRFKSRVLYNRNDGGYVQVSALSRDEDVALVQERLMSFAEEILELLPGYWPQEEVVAR
jgi:EpsI family protein